MCDFFGIDHELQKLAIQPYAADCDRRFAGQLARPARQVQLGAFELRLPETPGRTVKDVHACIGQRLHKFAQRLRRLHQPCAVILLFPL
ncbi:hypothetical protein APX70_01140 [Pseudomonas syringae pv. maculicola]|uniref:Uncharacterized protein n=1 Tax=Pseudomonas syringae pv. maculicola TaxID=59511 RepID=A0A3M2ZB52_PSEYM|nr:hypothetical protein APX70_01140 [Pseudomonas syringae pv. maculicola]